MLDLRTRKSTRVTNNPAPQFNPQISGHTIIWIDDRNGSWDIYAYDLERRKERRVSISDSQELYPSVFDSKIVYVDIVSVTPGGSSGNWDIKFFDSASGKRSNISATKDHQFCPSIYGDKVVWHDDRNGNWDIYMLDLRSGKETRVTRDLQDQIYPVVSGEFVTYQDNRAGNWDIYAFEFKTGREYAVAVGSVEQEQPRISGNRIVWHENGTGTDTDGDISVAYLPEAGRTPRPGTAKQTIKEPLPNEATADVLPSNPDAYTGPVTTVRQLYLQKCTLCHTVGRVESRYESPGFKSSSWKTIVRRMRLHNGAPITLEQENKIVDYLLSVYP